MLLRVGICCAISILALSARADGPGPLLAEDLQGFGERGPPQVALPSASRPSVSPRQRPARRVVGDSDYAGSVYGLGKPSFYGIGPRPDWGRSSTD